MVNIKLDPKYSLISDRNNWMIVEKSERSIKHLTFHSNIISALESYFEMKTKLSQAKSIKELILYQNSLLSTLQKLLHPLKIRLEVKELPPTAPVSTSKQGQI